MHCQKWGNQKTKIIPIKIKLRDETIKQLKVNENIKTFGSRKTPILNQDDEHKHIKNKLIISIEKK